MREISYKSLREKRLTYVKKMEKRPKNRFTHTFFFHVEKKKTLDYEVRAVRTRDQVASPSFPEVRQTLQTPPTAAASYFDHSHPHLVLSLHLVDPPDMPSPTIPHQHRFRTLEALLPLPNLDSFPEECGLVELNALDQISPTSDTKC